MSDLTDLIERLEGVLSIVRNMKAERDATEQAAAEDQEAAADEQQFPEHDLIDVATAAIRFRRKPDTIRHWCEFEGIGMKRGGRWMVSASMLRKREGY